MSKLTAQEPAVLREDELSLVLVLLEQARERVLQRGACGGALPDGESIDDPAAAALQRLAAGDPYQFNLLLALLHVRHELAPAESLKLVSEVNGLIQRYGG